MSVYSQISPWARNEERLVTEALIVADIPGAEIQAEVRPPLPQIQMFPPLYGYPDYQARQATIDSVLATDRMYQDRRSDTSGGPNDWMASARFVNGPYV